MIMKTSKPIVHFVLAFTCLFLALQAGADGASPRVLSILQEGFNVWTKKGPSYAFDVWKTGGMLEDDGKPAVLSQYFSRMDRTIGNYKSFEVIEAKRINQTSQIIYLSVNFEHAAIYGRFLLYRTDKNWVVQNLDFSPKPEALMPWLAFAGGTYNE
jgi:hypothetical protein